MMPRALRALLACAGVGLALAAPARAYGPRPDDSPLFKAVARGDLRALAGFAQRHADLSARDGGGQSGLIAAARYGREPVVRFFLAHGADIDARDMLGMTALHYAAESGNATLLAALLAANANPALYSHRCLTPADLAAGYAHERAYEELRRRLAAAPLPTDGTAEECGLSGKNPAGKGPAFAPARLAFHTRMLALDSVEDYGYVLESLRLLAEQPEFGQALVDPVLAVVDHPSPEGAEEYRSYDLMVRQAAVSTLGFVARTAALKARVAARLKLIVGTGGCDGFKASHCGAQALNSCRAAPAKDAWSAVKQVSQNVSQSVMKKLLGGAGAATGPAEPDWPRAPGAEDCFNCRWCEATRVANAFTAALTWFQANPSYAAGADQALASLVERKSLPRDEYRTLRQKYLRH